MFVKGSQMQFKDRKKVLSHGGGMMMVEVQLAPQQTLPPTHSHPHEQTSYLLSGSLNFKLGEQLFAMKKGDTVYIGSNVPHCVQSLEENTVILDAFTPQREDFLQS